MWFSRPISHPLWLSWLCLGLVSVAQASDADQPLKIFSGVLGTDRLDHIRRSGRPTVSLLLNKDKTKMGAEYSVCSSDLGFDDCDTLRFVFPQLRIDRVKHEIYFEEKLVASYDSHDRIKLLPGYTLVYEIQESHDDDGFNSTPVKHVVMYIVREKKPPLQS